MFQATVVKVFIASPNDVNEYRDQVLKIIQKWNSVNSEKTNTILFPVGWEFSVYPSLAMDAQSWINEKALNRSDILIGLFKHRVGTDLENGRTGTLEEIENFISQNKHCMIYFSSELVAQDADFEQLEKLKKFKTYIQQIGLYKEVNNPQQFGDELYIDLERLTSDLNLDIIEKIVKTKKDFSEISKYILEFAASDNGRILKVKTLTDITFQFGNHSEKISFHDGRKIAKYDEAIENLLKNKMIKDVGTRNTGEVFLITNLGYEYIDNL